MSKILSLAFLLLPLSAHAVHCIEYLETSGTPSLTPHVIEMTKAETVGFVAAVRKAGTAVSVVSSKPHLSMHGETLLVTFPNLSEEEFQVFGIEGPRSYLRPDVVEIQGFVKSEVKTPSPEYRPGSDLLKTRTRAIIYNSPGSPTAINLAGNEIISGAVNLGPHERLVITSRLEQKIGFATSRADREENYMIDVYYIEPTGHSWLGFRVPAGKNAYPKVDVVKIGDRALLLTLDDQTFHVLLEDASGTRSAASSPL